MANIVARTEHRFPDHSAAAVYDAWLDPEKVSAWMTKNLLADPDPGRVTNIEIDPRIGGKYRFSGTQNGEQSDSWGYYRALDPGKRIVFTWFVTPEEEEEDNSTVTLDLRPEGSGCVAAMSHEMDEEWAAYAEQTANAWNRMLRAIEETV